MLTNRQRRCAEFVAKARIVTQQQLKRFEFAHCKSDEPVQRLIANEVKRGAYEVLETYVQELAPTKPVFDWFRHRGDLVPPPSISRANPRDREFIESGVLLTSQYISDQLTKRWRYCEARKTLIVLPSRDLLNRFGIGQVERINFDQLSHDCITTDALLHYIEKGGDDVLKRIQAEHIYKRRFKGTRRVNAQKVFDAAITYDQFDDISPNSLRRSVQLVVESGGKYSADRVWAFLRHWSARVDAFAIW